LARGFQRMVQEVDARELSMKQAQESQKRSEQHFRSLIEHASDVITVLDKNGMVRYESPSLQRALGYAPGELLGRRFFEYVHPEDMTMFMASYAAASQTGETANSIEFRFRHATAGWRVLEAVTT